MLQSPAFEGREFKGSTGRHAVQARPGACHPDRRGASPAFAQANCEMPIPPAAPDGRTASQQQIAGAVTDAKNFIAQSDVYQSCLLDYVKTKKEQAANAMADKDNKTRSLSTPISKPRSRSRSTATRPPRCAPAPKSMPRSTISSWRIRNRRQPGIGSNPRRLFGRESPIIARHERCSTGTIRDSIRQKREKSPPGPHVEGCLTVLNSGCRAPGCGP